MLVVRCDPHHFCGPSLGSYTSAALTEMTLSVFYARLIVFFPLLCTASRLCSDQVALDADFPSVRWFACGLLLPQLVGCCAAVVLSLLLALCAHLRMVSLVSLFPYDCAVLVLLTHPEHSALEIFCARY